jgi:uncharacterized repeat protein (TIGR02543 family)
MYFDINDNLLPSLGQRVQLNVTYLDRGTGQFRLLYDAVSSAQKTAFTVTKMNTDTWKTQSIEVTDWRFGNRSTNGSDLQLVNVATDAANPDTIFHGIELIKQADVSVGIIGQGTVTGRNNAAAFTAIPASVMEGQRLELQATPAPGWVFAGWSGALSGTNANPFLFPTKDTRLTATFTSTSSSATRRPASIAASWRARVASGGVGSAAVQLAKRRGAYVVAMAGADKAQAVQALGADQLVPRDADLAALVGADYFNAAVDSVGGAQFGSILNSLKQGGRYGVAGAIAGPMVDLDLRTLYLKDLRLIGCTVLESEVFANLVSYIENGEIRPVVAATYDLFDIVKAQEAFLTKQHVGKIVLSL